MKRFRLLTAPTLACAIAQAQGSYRGETRREYERDMREAERKRALIAQSLAYAYSDPVPPAPPSPPPTRRQKRNAFKIAREAYKQSRDFWEL